MLNTIDRLMIHDMRQGSQPTQPTTKDHQAACSNAPAPSLPDSDLGIPTVHVCRPSRSLLAVGEAPAHGRYNMPCWSVPRQQLTWTFSHIQLLNNYFACGGFARRSFLSGFACDQKTATKRSRLPARARHAPAAGSDTKPSRSVRAHEPTAFIHRTRPAHTHSAAAGWCPERPLQRGERLPLSFQPAEGRHPMSARGAAPTGELRPCARPARQDQSAPSPAPMPCAVVTARRVRRGPRPCAHPARRDRSAPSPAPRRRAGGAR